MDYFSSKFEHDLRDTVEAFKSAQLFVPCKIAKMRPDAIVVEDLKAFPYFNYPTLLANLKGELPAYLAKAADVSPEMDPLGWWRNHSGDLPHWSAAARNVDLAQPSSAAAERAFSILKASFGPQQEKSLQDYVESAIMLQYNMR